MIRRRHLCHEDQTLHDAIQVLPDVGPDHLDSLLQWGGDDRRDLRYRKLHGYFGDSLWVLLIGRYILNRCPVWDCIHPRPLDGDDGRFLDDIMEVVFSGGDEEVPLQLQGQRRIGVVKTGVGPSHVGLDPTVKLLKTLLAGLALNPFSGMN